MNDYINQITSLTEEIDSDLTYTANVLDLASRFDLSPWHFQRLFKSIVGDSLGKYIRGRRLSKASELLLNTERTIIEIAIDVGFNSHESFTRSFKSYFEMTPKEFRIMRPSVLIKKKPLLTTELLKHITKGMDLEPDIKIMPEQVIIGMETEVPSPFTTKDAICNFVGQTWFSLFDREDEIKHSNNSVMYALTKSPSGNFTEDLLRYIAGIPVNKVETVPDGMTAATIPEQKVAIFHTMTDIDEEVAKRTIDYIYGYWLFNSGYERGNGNDFEMFTDIVDKYTGKFTSNYIIPLK